MAEDPRVEEVPAGPVRTGPAAATELAPPTGEAVPDAAGVGGGELVALAAASSAAARSAIACGDSRGRRDGVPNAAGSVPSTAVRRSARFGAIVRY